MTVDYLSPLFITLNRIDDRVTSVIEIQNELNDYLVENESLKTKENSLINLESVLDDILDGKEFFQVRLKNKTKIRVCKEWINQQRLLHKPKNQFRFTIAFPKNAFNSVYIGLTTGGFLPKDETGVDYKAFCYIFGNGDVVDFKFLNWIGNLKDLSVFINTFYSDETSKWEKTGSCFLCKNNAVKINSLKTAITKTDSNPPSVNYFKTLKNNLFKINQQATKKG